MNSIIILVVFVRYCIDRTELTFVNCDFDLWSITFIYKINQLIYYVNMYVKFHKSYIYADCKRRVNYLLVIPVSLGVLFCASLFLLLYFFS